MSKRYVIQVKAAAFGQEPEWLNLQHPNGGDWMTRSRSTAIADAARLKHEGETRELRVMLSRPVYELVDAGVSSADIDSALEMINLDTVSDDNDDDDDDDDDELTEKLEAQVGLVPDTGPMDDDHPKY